jgi:hypothetical protein
VPGSAVPSDPFTADRREPPAHGITGTPVIEILSAGQRLWRIHRAADDPCAFPARVYGIGGRFDSPTPGVTQLYLGDSPQACVAETILRDMPLSDSGPRLVPRVGVAARAITEVTLERELRLVSLHGPHASAIGQGAWLTKSTPADYPLTRAWADAIRAAVPDAHGLLWRCRFDEDRLAIVLYSDRAPGALGARRTFVTDSGVGLSVVRKCLLAHSAVVGP